MAMTHDYRDCLDREIGIAPAGSQEELQASQTIATLMSQHGIEPKVEEFETPSLTGLLPHIISVLVLLGIIFAGTDVVVLKIIGFLLAIVPAVLAGLSFFGIGRKPSLGGKVRSQNVVAFHPAEGPLVERGRRKIVVVAHYDTPHENVLYGTPVAQYIPLLTKVSYWCGLGIALCALIQVMVFLPAPFRVLVWLLGIVAALPAVVLAVGAISERFTASTFGANDNKASVAALLGVMENVSPSGMVPTVREPEKPLAAAESDSNDGDAATGATSQFAAEPQVRMVEQVEQVEGTRHGEEVLRQLGILPASCEIEYVAPKVTTVAVPAAAEETLAGTSSFRVLMNEGGEGVGEKDDSGLTATDGTYDLDSTRPSAPVGPQPKPAAPEDPEWGKTEFRPQVSDVARRASLFDLPDPSQQRGVDPFSTGASQRTAAEEQPEEAPLIEPLQTIGAPAESREPKSKRSFGGLSALADRLKSLGSRRAAEDDDDPNEDDGWRGGATPREGLRLVGNDEDAADSQSEVPTDEELVEAVLTLDDDELRAHDIWFVALGASSYDHAGMRAFLAEHRREIRGSFVINLDCVGAGNLTVLTREGRENTRRIDRRIMRLLEGVAGDLHTELARVEYDWADTDATVAMQSSIRSATIIGMGENGLPALSRTAADVPDAVSGDQAARVCDIVTEVIRRS